MGKNNRADSKAKTNSLLAEENFSEGLCLDGDLDYCKPTCLKPTHCGREYHNP